MSRPVLLILVGTILLLPATGVAQEIPANHAKQIREGTELFRKTIRPALKKHCLKCHGGEKVRSAFDLSSRDLLLKGGESGAVVDVKNASESYLLQLIRHDEEPTMPPAEGKLPNPLIADMERWIRLGAPYDKPLIDKADAKPKPMVVTKSDREFWSFRPLANPAPPSNDGKWGKTEIDQFVHAKLRKHGLTPSPPASDRVRIRRAYLTLIGLPPNSQQLEKALTMTHGELVDELLDSPHYGERWARHWLDAARFAESHGFEQDYDRKFAYHYRDFVIKAFNDDMPWDQFVKWQIAGDEVAPNEPLAMMATGFLGAGVFPTQLTEKEFESARYDELDDMAATVGTAMLGLTVGCARCHDHKFDPLPVDDYYRFVSTFTTTIRSEIDLDLNPQEYQAKLKQWKTKHAATIAARKDYEQRPELKSKFDQWLKTDAASTLAEGEWTILDVSEATSSQKATTLTRQPDGAILASGKPPAREAYTIKATTSGKPIRFFRIEALTHPSMKRGGPGRAGNGNFALSDLKVFATPLNQSGSKRKSIKIASAKATHQQNTTNLSVASAFDDNSSGTGWAVDHGGIGKDQAAVFELANPLEFDDEVQLEFRLTFTNNGQHSLGRFRLSVSRSNEPPVIVGNGTSESLADAVAALNVGQLTQNHRDVLFPIFASSDSGWSKLDNEVQKSLSQKPQPSLVKVQVSSEGLPPTKHHADGRGFPHFYPETHFLDRGDPNQKRGVAESGFLQVLMRNGKTSEYWHQSPPDDWTRTSYRRTSMANWITDTEYGAGHLLARVIVNRIWHHHFGRGLVATPNDFGLQGTPPTHPELLDFLATRLIESGWNLKPLHKEILLSAAWLQSSLSSREKAKLDPDNKWLWRFKPRRLEAEIVRDTMLAASGQLDEKMFGPGTLDQNHRRRSIYFMIKRSRLVPMMQIFDQPEPLSSQGSRPSTTIAPQALMFMNNRQVVRWAASFAASVNSDDTDVAIREIYRRALARDPSDMEFEHARDFVAAQAASYETNKNGRQLALADLCQVVFGLNEFIYLR